MGEVALTKATDPRIGLQQQFDDGLVAGLKAHGGLQALIFLLAQDPRLRPFARRWDELQGRRGDDHAAGLQEEEERPERRHLPAPAGPGEAAIVQIHQIPFKMELPNL